MRKLGRFIRDCWYANCRKRDIELLWPVCRQNAKDIYHAKAAFRLHCAHDKAWLELEREHVDKIIETLE